MKKILTIVCLLIATISFAQLQNANWCFPYTAKVTFNGTLVSTGQCNNTNNITDPYGYTCASVSNSNGELLFYSDGVKVWDKTGAIMSGGQNIGGGISAGKWTEQGIVIVPKPGSETIYYIFTACKIEDVPHLQNHAGFHYSVVDITLNGGNGAVILNKIPLKDEGGNDIDYDVTAGTGLRIYESSITTALNKNSDAIWVTLFTRFHTNNVVKRIAYSYLLESGTFNPLPVHSSLLPNNCPFASPTCLDIGGSIKISPDGKYLLNEARELVDMYLFDNDNANPATGGSVTYQRRVYTGVPVASMPGYGIEFSPGSNRIYFSTYDCGLCQENPLQSNESSGNDGNRKNYIRIRQANVIPQMEDTANTNIIIGQFEVPPPNKSHDLVVIPATTYGDLQLAPNGKIYACALEPIISPSNANLGVINQPDELGLNCQYVNNGVTLSPGTWQTGSLPQWVHKVKPFWPKIYEAAESNGIKMDNQGNLFHAIYFLNMANNINHSGQTTNSTGDHYVQYNKTTGITTWVNSNYFWIYFALSSGDVNVVTSTGNNVYIDGSLGVLVSGPTNNISPTERILAEDNGAIITKSGYSLYAHSSSGAISLPVSIPTIPGYSLTNDIIGREAFYNPDPGSRNLYVSHIYTNGSSTIRLLGIYHYDLGTNTLSAVNTPASNQLNGPMIQVNTKIPAEVFVYNYNGTIEKYDYQNGIHTPLSASNFINSSLEIVQRSNQVVEDRILIKSTSQNVFYCVNTVSLAAKKILFTPPSTNFQFYNHYIFDGDYVFIAGEYTGTGFTIGNQIMPLLGNASAFITKFNIQADFSFGLVSEDLLSNQKEGSIKTIPLLIQQNKSKKELQSADITATLSPNPAKNKLQINIKQVNSKEAESYQITIANSQGITLYKQDTKQRSISVDISAFRTGMYYVNISNMKGNRTAHTFIKE